MTKFPNPWMLWNGRNISWIAFILVLVGCQFAMFDASILNISTRRWDKPTNLTFKLNDGFDGSNVQQVKFIIAAQSSIPAVGDYPILVDYLHQCTLIVNEKSEVEYHVSRFYVENNVFGIKFNLKDSHILQSLDLFCNDILLRPSPQYPFQDSDGATFQITVFTVESSGTDESEIHMSNPLRIEISHPGVMFYHHYYWSHNSAEIMTKFTFFRPSTTSEFKQFDIIHPLLDFNPITSMHSSNGQHPVDDLLRLTHLLDLDVIQNNRIECIPPTPTWPSGHIEFKRQSNQIQPYFEIEDYDGDSRYQCSFEIPYPPDVLMAILEKKIHVQITPIQSDNTPMIPVSSSLSFPYTIPQQYVNEETQHVRVWLSPHHHLNSIKSFEFGLAVLQSTYTDTGGIDALQRTRSTFSFHFVDAEGEVASYTDLYDWKYRMKFRQHNAREYHSDDVFNDDIKDDDGNDQILAGGFGLTYELTLLEQKNGYDTTASRSLKVIPVIITLQNTEAIDVAIRTPTSMANEPEFYLHDTDSLPSPQSLELPSTLSCIHFTRQEDSKTGSVLATGRMRIQSMLPYLTQSRKVKLSLHLLFTNLVNESDLTNQIKSEPNHCSITITTHGHHVLKTVCSFEFGGIDYPSSLFDTKITTDDIGTIFQPRKTIFTPRLSVPIFDEESDVFLDASQPVEVTIQFGVKPMFQIEEMVIYPYLTSFTSTKLSTFSPSLARITPIPSQPLVGYSYRCVTWDKMASKYVYGANSPLTDQNSTPCSTHVSYDNTTGISELDVTRTDLWKRVEQQSAYDTCFYELPAVCVTKNQSGTYDVHPLADCPSFLGEIHAVPCSALIGDKEWNTYLSVKLEKTTPHDSASINTPSVSFTWVYNGDPRRLVNVWMSIASENRQWVQIATLPAYIAPPGGMTSHSFHIPRFGPTSQVHIDTKFQIDGPEYSATGLGPLVLNIPSGAVAGCEENANKHFDPHSHLCICKDGYESSKPTGIDNPMIHPTDFDCLIPCTSKHYRNPRTLVCEPILPDDKTCHTIPDHIQPPFYTNHCGYGVPNDKECDKCTCLSQWVKETGAEPCTVCRLTLPAHCVVEHTDLEAVSKPEYCWVGRCLCKPGFYGPKCEHKVIYGTLEYTKPTFLAPNENNEFTIVRRRVLNDVEERIVTEIKTAIGGEQAKNVHMFLQQATQRVVPGNSDDENSELDNTMITTIVIGMQPLKDNDGEGSDGGDGEDGTPFIHLANGDDFSDLYGAWQDLQDSGAGNIPVDPDFGQVGGIQPPYDPHCVPNEFTSCPEGENNLVPPENQVDPDELEEVYKEDTDATSSSNTTTYIIIGVVVGVVLLLFIALIVAILYCRKHEKMCFRKRKTKGASSKTPSHHASSTAGLELTKASSHSSTPPSAPPSSTISTSSYLPTQVGANDPTLPADWIALEDKSTGKVYYSNKVTMESSWDHPAKPKEKPKSAYGW